MTTNRLRMTTAERRADWNAWCARRPDATPDLLAYWASDEFWRQREADMITADAIARNPFRLASHYRDCGL